jgi:tetratricopeptide (TPR) repeat protein
MSEKPTFETIDAATVELTGTTPEHQPKPAARSRMPLLLTAVGVALVILVIGVIFLLPRWIEERTASLPVTSTPAVPVTEESPYLKAQLAEARKQAQAILAELISAQKTLTEKNVEQWAAERYGEITTLAQNGDLAYREGRFDQALSDYQSALTLAGDLLTEGKTLVSTKLAEGKAAIDAGNQSAAVAAFKLVLALEPDNAKAAAGLKRAALLEQTLPLVEQAKMDIADRHFEAAKANLGKALALDPALTVASALLKEVKQAIADAGFNRAMSAGFAALEADKYEDAINQFERATRLKPGDTNAQSSLSQARLEGDKAFVRESLARASTLEQAERWQDAAGIYSKILDRDSSVVEARVGQLKAKARAELDQQIRTILADPLRLASDSVLSQGRRLLVEADKIDNPGPTLREQKKALGAVLLKATIPVTVTLTSDNRTNVTVLRVKELGTFERQELTLRPGRYVALGSRPGYRDVRVSFDVTGDGSPPVAVVCEEPV